MRDLSYSDIMMDIDFDIIIYYLYNNMIFNNDQKLIYLKYCHNLEIIYFDINLYESLAFSSIQTKINCRNFLIFLL